MSAPFTGDMNDLLDPMGSLRQIGDEQMYDVDGSVVIFRSTDGASYRFLWQLGDQIISGLQVVTHDGKNAQVARVYTLPEFRRKGYASSLLKRARCRFETLAPSTQLSPDGRAWTDANWYELGENG